MGPEPSRRRDAEEQLGGDVVRARLQDPQGVVRTVEEARLQPREELGAAVDSICKHARSWGAPSASSQVLFWTCGVEPGLGGRSTGVLEDVTCGVSRFGDWITAESKASTLDQRRTRSASPGDQTPQHFAVPSIDGRQSVEYTFSTNIHGELPRGTCTA